MGFMDELIDALADMVQDSFKRQRGTVIRRQSDAPQVGDPLDSEDVGIEPMRQELDVWQSDPEDLDGVLPDEFPTYGSQPASIVSPVQPSPMLQSDVRPSAYGKANSGRLRAQEDGLRGGERTSEGAPAYGDAGARQIASRQISEKPQGAAGVPFRSAREVARDLVRDRDAARKALIFAEIFGPPKGERMAHPTSWMNIPEDEWAHGGISVVQVENK